MIQGANLHCEWPCLRATLALLSLVVSCAAHALPTSGQTPAATQSAANQDLCCEAELLLVARINGIPQLAGEHIVRMTDGRLAAHTETLQRWRLRIPPVAPFQYEDESYYPLDAIPDLKYRLNETTQELELEIPLANLLPSNFEEITELQRNFRISPGGFFNYDLLTQQSTNSQVSNGLLEAGIFNQHGVGTGTFLWQNHDVPHAFTRLETAWTHDDQESMTRLQLGDSINRAGSWGRAVRFGGVQWRSNFDTQPGFITFPQPGITGMAVLPSTADVYINNTRRISREVQPGPFEIPNLPVVTGAGEVRLVVSDILGRQQVINQPYYASQSLLRKGLSDFSVEAGFARRNYGLSGNRYGPPFAVATQRHGVSDRFTRELRAEILPNQQTAGIGGVYFWSSFSTAQTAIAVSHGPDGDGTLFVIGAEQHTRDYSWSMQKQYGSFRFTELGWVNGNIRPRSSLSLHLGFTLDDQGSSLSLSHLDQQYWGQPGSRIWSVNYSRRLFQDYFLLLYASLSESGGTSGRSFGVNLSRGLGERTSGNVQFNRQNAGTDSLVQIQKNLPDGPGFGYRLMAQEGLRPRQEAGGAWQTNHGTYTAAVSQQPGNSSTRLGASGGIAFLGGASFLSLRIDDSFAVVNAGGYPNVRVYYENRPAGTTDHRGLALIPHLRPYQQNRIGIEADDLPIEAQADQLELKLTTALRSGTYADFPVRTIHGGTLTIVLEDGSFIPSGATVSLRGRPEEYPVGLHGEVFLPELAESNELLITWKQQECKISVKLPPGSPPLADLGRHLCTGIKS